MRVSDDVKNCTVFIGECGSRGFVPTATGFVVIKKTGDQYFEYLVTAQHAVIHGRPLYVRINKTDGRAGVYELRSDKWYYHPSADRVVDVAVLPTHLPSDIFDHIVINLEDEIASEEVIKAYDVGVGDELVFPGLFVHHSGQGRNLPVMRAGTLGAMPDEPVMTASGPMHLYLAEARSIGGQSGSPVFLNMQAPREFRSLTPKVDISEKPYYLLGLMRSHLRAKDSGEYATDDPKTEDLWINSGIATVVPVQDIVDTVSQPSLEELRMSAIKESRDRSVDMPTSVQLKRDPEPATNPAENPDHREDFNRLVGAASKPKPKDDRT